MNVPIGIPTRKRNNLVGQIRTFPRQQYHRLNLRLFNENV
jgi:hypothetical protein